MVEAIETDAENCRATIYNSQPLHLLNYLDEIIKAGAEYIRLNFTIESKVEMMKIIKEYQQKLKSPEENVGSTINEYTTGHFYRGVK
ncbi:MAG: DUF3656 domain-containing U32 family peptidase, partial [Bacillota bacterium]